MTNSCLEKALKDGVTNLLLIGEKMWRKWSQTSVSPATARSASSNQLVISEKSWMSDAVLHSAGVCCCVVPPDGAGRAPGHETGVLGSRLYPPSEHVTVVVLQVHQLFHGFVWARV